MKFMQMIAFNLGYVAAFILGWRDKTWAGDARVFLIAGCGMAEYTAPDGNTNYRFKTDVWNDHEAYVVGELNADYGQRYWALRATDEALVTVIKRNRQLRAEWAGSKAMETWLDQEHGIAMAEVKHRYRFHRTRISEEAAQIAIAA